MSLRDNPGAAVSGGMHALLLAAALLSFSHTAKFEDAQESIPVDMVSDQEFNQIMKGEKTAAKREKPQQKVEKLAEVAEAKPQSTLPDAKVDIPAPPTRAKLEDDPGRDDAKSPPEPPERPVQDNAKAEPKPELKPEVQKPVVAAAPPPAPPSAESPDAVEPKPVPRPKAEPKKVTATEPKPKPAEPPKKAEPKFKPDELAKLLEQEKPQKDQPPKPAAKPKSGEEAADPADKFDASDISRFLNKEAPQKKASTGHELQQVASLGAATASALKMSPSLWAQLDGLLQDQYRHCWNYVGVTSEQKYVPEIHVQYGQDGAVMGQPELLNPPSDPNMRSLAESALRAVRRCNPLRIPAQYQPYYDQWKGRVVRFDPEDML
ncbi:cell envelope biogenesis protein TolA [Methylocella tundrae]|uniref:TolA protein n=1 Tax=Methylocella tundrae TaxID=227605 RepID=A0A4V6IME8_METTU|nr:cell envelope biogenesis protein TolA [Methylocella tundrae]WPP05722.1 cell envelope biogenesis protein TolA [Methylocella tundrae]VFU08209.1 TolA protein [Methylocella tundrae]